VIFLVCACGIALRINGDAQEVNYLLGEQSSWYPDKYVCPGVACGAAMHYAESVEGLENLDLHDLTAGEAYAAMHGLGLPSERACGAAEVRDLLTGAQILGVDCAQIIGSTRTVLRSIKLAGGKTVYLGSGPEGAIAYRIAAPRSYTQEVLGG
jgi:hypothetical protein